MNIISIKNLSFSHSPEKEVLKDVVVDIKKGETLGIEGVSGSGKSTLAGCLCGMWKGYRGEIVYAPPLKKGHRGIEGIHLIFQDPYSSINPRFTVLEAVAEGLHIKKRLPRAAVRMRVASLMSLVGLSEDLLNKRVASLSGGERQRVAIARGLALEPSVLIFDEATVSLDLISQREVLSVMEKLRETEITLIVISHDRRLLELLSHRILLVEEKRVREVWSSSGSR